ncbi:MAG: hypothetical protein PHF37_04000 [Phycisphaerae bacterium]|nr:hypothetical protein [Phycisphaerae bacterium]
MDFENTVRKFSLDKVALLGFLVFGLFAAKLLVFARNEKPLRAGAQLVEAVKNNQLTPPAGQKTPLFLLMKNKSGQSVGFLIDHLDSSDSKLQGSSILYMQTPLHQERVTSFEGTGDLSEFVWKYDAASPFARASLQTQYSDSVLTVTNFDGQGREYQINPQSPWLPDILTIAMLRNMLDSDINKALLELLVPEGRLVPATISKIETKNSDVKVVVIEYLDAQRVVEQYIFNKDRTIAGINTSNGYTFQPVSIQTILALFPEKADYILQQFKFLQEQDSEENNRIYKDSV